MSYQIDFLPIGDKKCGDAIVVRFGDLSSSDPSRQSVVVIDGGYAGDGNKVLEHIGAFHPNVNQIDLVISTHLDVDHIAGLPGIIENSDVKELWMHLPWEHSQLIKTNRALGFVGSSGRPRIIKSLQGASRLAQVAYDNGITPIEPFYGETVFYRPFGRITVLGPTRDYYETLVPDFTNNVPPKTATIIPQSLTQAAYPAITLAELSKILSATKGESETHFTETLQHGQTTNSENNSSTILLLEAYDGAILRRFLFTGDAGVPALEIAHNNLMFEERRGYTNTGNFAMVQVPHHTSRKNVDPTILDKFLGPITAIEGEVRGSAIASISQNDCVHGHPKKVVTNAFKRRGYPVAHTKGGGVLLHSAGDARPTWSSASTFPLYPEVESYDD